MPDELTRREVLIAAVAASALPFAGCAMPAASGDGLPPIIFVPGNGDSAALWTTTIWRFESNGWPRDRLHSIDMPYPLARDDDGKEQPGRSSTAEHRAYLAAAIDKVLAATGASKVALVGNSRGGNAIRSYVAEGGATRVSHIVLATVPNHGILINTSVGLGNEFNGAGNFLRKLNAPQGAEGTEVTAGIRWMTIRSDHEDKYAQPDGASFGRRGLATNITFDGPALKGAENVVIASVDHREAAHSAKAFAEIYRFIAGRPPTTLTVVPESRVVLDGIVSRLGLANAVGDFPTNLPLAGASTEVYEVDPGTGERRGDARHRKTIGADGHWGPFTADGSAHYEFVVAAAGYATTHIYRSPFPRSSAVVCFHPERLAPADGDAGALVIFNRVRGYFGVPRDRIMLDGVSPPAGLPDGVPSISTARLKAGDRIGRTVVGEFNGERIVGRTWPVADNQVVVLELTY